MLLNYHKANQLEVCSNVIVYHRTKTCSSVLGYMLGLVFLWCYLLRLTLVFGSVGMFFAVKQN